MSCSASGKEDQSVAQFELFLPPVSNQLLLPASRCSCQPSTPTFLFRVFLFPLLQTVLIRAQVFSTSCYPYKSTGLYYCPFQVKSTTYKPSTLEWCPISNLYHSASQIQWTKRVISQSMNSGLPLTSLAEHQCLATQAKLSSLLTACSMTLVHKQMTPFRLIRLPQLAHSLPFYTFLVFIAK